MIRIHADHALSVVVLMLLFPCFSFHAFFHLVCGYSHASPFHWVITFTAPSGG